MNDLSCYIFYFIIYSFLGWVCEDIYVGVGQGKFVNRGFFYGPYCPIYGFGALVVLILLLPYNKNPILVFFGGVILTSILEYFTSWIMEVLFHERWWDYSSYPFNIHGRVCLRNSLLFGLMALVIIYIIHPYIDKLFICLSTKFPMILYGLYILVFLGMIIDSIFTLKSLLKRNSLITNIHKLLQELEETQKELTLEIIQNSPQISEKLHLLKELENTHLAKAFPERIVKKGHIHRWIQEIKKKDEFY